ncbi:MAG: hypothetical protein LBU04_00620, partial [Christensenellaceae bacterium]|nr:hypothetical protein [Christensenellaceae bacterium]
MSDGSYNLISYAEDIHYLDEDGKFKEIDNTLEKEGEFYKNKANSLSVKIPQNYTDTSKTIVSLDNYEISFKLLNYNEKIGVTSSVESLVKTSSVQSRKEYNVKLNNESSIKYELNKNNVELEQVVVGTNLKENIIVNSPLLEYKFSFSINTNNLALILLADGDIVANNSEGERVFTIPKGFMYDSAGKISDAVEYTLNSIENGEYILSITAQSQWINSKERQFPVTIDPSVTTNLTNLKYGYRNTSYNSNVDKYVLKGWDSTNPVHDVFGLKFDLPTLPVDAIITNAILKVFSATAYNNALTLLYESRTSWATSSLTRLTQSLYFDNNTTTSTILPDFEACVTGGVIDYNITRNLKNVYEYGTDWNGFFITRPAGTTASIEIYTKSNVPELTLSYRRGSGIEEYWDATTYSTSNDLVYINNYNNLATVVHDDITTGGELPISIEHIFTDTYRNSNFNVTDVDNCPVFGNLNLGYGWKLNYQQAIRLVGNNFYYYDADATMHYFVRNEQRSVALGKNVAEDEDGLGLTLMADSSYAGAYYKMTNKNNMKLFFDYHGRLIRIEDPNGNANNIIYGNGNQGNVLALKITQINDQRSSSTSLYRYVNFEYDSNGYLTKLISKSPYDITKNVETTFSYSSNRLVEIMSYDNTYSYFLYNANGKIKSIIDHNYYAILLEDLLISFSNTYVDAQTGATTTTNTIYYGRVITENFYEGFTGNTINYTQGSREELLFLNGLTYSITAKAGEPFVEFSSTSDAYFTDNFTVASVFDNQGRLVSSYVAGQEITTTVAQRYTTGTNERVNNKVVASTSYESNIVNYITNGGGESTDTSSDVPGWAQLPILSSSFTSIKQSNKYAYAGKNSIEVFSSQPLSGENRAIGLPVIPSAGNYILSAYVRVTDTLMYAETHADDYGAFIRVGSSYETVTSEVISSDYFNTNNGFKLLLAPFYASNSGFVSVELGLRNCSGFAYFDSIQLTHNDYGYVDETNYAENQGFENWQGILPDQWNLWTEYGSSPESHIQQITGSSAFSGETSVLFKGGLNGSANLYQRVSIPHSENTTAYTLSIWVNTLGRIFNPSPLSRVQLNYRLLDENDGALPGNLSAWCPVSIAIDSPYWHQVAATIIVPSIVKKIEINIELNRTNTVICLDNISLVQSDIVNMEYDLNGNNTGYVNSSGTYLEAEYQGNDVEIDSNIQEEFGIVKDANGNVKTAKDYKRNTKISYEYDAYGRVTLETFSGIAKGSKNTTVQTAYSDISSNWESTVINVDSLGFKTISKFSAFYNFLEKAVSSDGTFTTYVYGYDSTLTNETKTLTVSEYAKDGTSPLWHAVFTYYLSNEYFSDGNSIYHSKGLLKSITTENGTVYSYKYDKWGNVISVSLGNGTTTTTMLKYTYREIDGALVLKTALTGFAERYTYDTLGRLSKTEERESSLSEFITAYEWVYAVDGRLIKMLDHKNGKKYEYTYDARGSVILSAVGALEASSYDVFFESEYDAFGDIKRTNLITKNATPMSGMIASNIIPKTGTYSRTRSGLYEYIYIDNVEQIKYTYSSTDEKTSFIVREDNKLNNNTSYPNGSTIRYTRDARGKLLGFTFSSYNNTSDGVFSVGSYYTIRSRTYEYDNGVKNIWDSQYAADMTTSGTPTIITTPETSGDITINNILLTRARYYPNAGASLVNQKYLMTANGSVSIRYMMRLGSAVSGLVGGLSFVYTDGTADNSTVQYAHAYFDGSGGTNWKEMYLVSNPNKTIIKLYLMWGPIECEVYLGNVQVEISNNAWDIDYIIANQQRASSAPVTKVADIDINNNNTYIITPYTDILRLNHSSHYVNTVGETDVYQSLVDPSILTGGGVVSVNYYIRRETTTYAEIKNLTFKYTDGSISPTVFIPQDTNWHYYTMTSDANKVVCAIELRWWHCEWVQIANVRVITQGLGRKDGRLTGEVLENGEYANYTYDELGRLAETKISKSKTNSTQILKEKFTYLDGSGSSTSNTVTSKNVTVGGLVTTYNYVYNMNNNGNSFTVSSQNLSTSNPYNIYQVYEDNSLKATYYYDALGQLIREDNAYIGQTIEYYYDSNKNITSKKVFSYTSIASPIPTTPTKTYSYNYDTTYYDRLIDFDGKVITYNEIGSPLTYKGSSLIWDGSNLKQLTNSNGSTTYQYDSSGLRLSKTTGHTTTNYLYSGSKLLREKTNSSEIWYLYNELGLIGFEYNLVTYHYLRNYEGDVVAVIDTSGVIVASYTYDAFGKIISKTGTMSDINPIRYRGYYYDDESS